MERPVYFLPSEVSRLILGYLKETEHVQSYKCFLNECKHLSEYADMLKQGIEYPTTIMGISLLTMLQEYARLKLKETNLQGVDMGTALKQFDAVTKKAKENVYHSKSSPSNQPRKRPPKRSTARKEDPKKTSEKESKTDSNKDAENEELSVVPVCRSSVRINPDNTVLTPQVFRRKVFDRKKNLTEITMASQIFSLTPSTSGVACKELEFPEESLGILKKKKKKRSKLSYRHKYRHKKQADEPVIDSDGQSDQEAGASDGNDSDALPDLDPGRSVLPERTSQDNRDVLDNSIALTNSTQFTFDAKLRSDRRNNDDIGDMSDDSLSRSDVVFDSTHHTDFDVDLETDLVVDTLQEEKKKLPPVVHTVQPTMSNSSHTDSHALHIDQQSPIKRSSLQKLHEQRTPVKAFLNESQTCDSGRSPRRKRHQPKRYSDSLEVLVPHPNFLPPPPPPALPTVDPPLQHKEDTTGQTDPFPLLLEKIINDTRLHERLAETINKSRITNHPHLPCNKPVATSTIVDDFFSPGGHNMVSEDTIDGLIHMTKNDPLFDSLLSMFGPECAKAVASTIGVTPSTTTAPQDHNNSSFASISESDMMELSQDGFTTSTAPTRTVDPAPSTTLPAARVSSPCPSLSSPCPSLSSSVGSPGQLTNQKKRRIKPTPCHPLTSVLPAFSSPIMHEMSPAATPEPCSPAPSPFILSSTSAHNSLMSPPPCTVTQNPMSSPAPFQHPSSPAPTHQPSPAPIEHQPSPAPIHQPSPAPTHQPSPVTIHQPSPAPVEHQQSPAAVHQPSQAPIEPAPIQYQQSPAMMSPAPIQYQSATGQIEHQMSPAPLQPLSASTQHSPASFHNQPSPAPILHQLLPVSIQNQQSPVPIQNQPSPYGQQSLMSPPANIPVHRTVPVQSPAPVTQHQPCSLHVPSSALPSSDFAVPSPASSVTSVHSAVSQHPASPFLSQVQSHVNQDTPGTTSHPDVSISLQIPQGSTDVLPASHTITQADPFVGQTLLNVSSLCQSIKGTSEGSDQFSGLVMLASAATTSQQAVQIIPAQCNLQTLTPGSVQPDSNVVIPQVQVQSLTSEPEVMAEQSDTPMSGVNISIQENGIIEAFSKGKTSTCRRILPLTSIPRVSVRANESPPAGTALPVTKPKKKSGKSVVKEPSLMDSNKQTVTSLANDGLNTVLSLADSGLQTVTQLPGSIVSQQPSAVPPVTDAQSILGPLASGHLPPGMVDNVQSSNTQMSFDLLAENNLSQFAFLSPKKRHDDNPSEDVSYPTVIINNEVYELTMSPNSQNLNIRNPKPLVETQMNSRPTVTVIAPQLPKVKPKKRKSKKKQEQQSTLSPSLSALQNVIRQQTPNGKRPNILSKSPKSSFSKSGISTNGYFVSPNRTSEENTELEKQSSASTSDYVAIPLGKICEDVPKKSLSFESESISISPSSTNTKTTSKKKASVKTNKAAKLKKDKVHGSSKGKNDPESGRQSAIKENSKKTLQSASKTSLTSIKPCCVAVTPLKQPTGSRLMSATPSTSSLVHSLSHQSSSSSRKVRILEPVTSKSDSIKSVPSFTETTSGEAQGSSSLPADQSPPGTVTQAPGPTNNTECQAKDLLTAPPAKKSSSPTPNPNKSPVKPDINGNCGAHSEDSLSQDSSIMTAASDPGPVLEKGAPVGMRGRKMVALTMSAQSRQKINGSSTSFILAGNRKRTSSQVDFDQNTGEKVKKKKKSINLEKINLDHLLSKIHKKC